MATGSAPGPALDLDQRLHRRIEVSPSLTTWGSRSSFKNAAEIFEIGTGVPPYQLLHRYSQHLTLRPTMATNRGAGPAEGSGNPGTF